MGRGELKPAASLELGPLSRLLQGAFSGQEGALYYSPTVTGLLLNHAVDSLVLIDSSAILGLVMATPRRAWWGARPLSLLHVGPLAVSPRAQRQGVGRRLLEAVKARAEGQGVDLVTLTAQPGGAAHRLYQRLGYASMGDATPLLRQAKPGAVRGMRPWSPDWPAPEAVDGHIVERGPLSEAPPLSLAPRRFEHGPSMALSLRWPMQSRGGWRWVTQIVAARAPTEALLASVCAQASRDGSAAVWALLGGDLKLPGFRAPEVSPALRLGLPLTKLGAEAADAQGYVTLGISG